MSRRPKVLYLDTASPVVSVALGTGGTETGEPVFRGTVLSERTIALRRSSELLLKTIEEMLGETGATLRELHGVAALQGPGSFTGLRIGLATVLGLSQALGLRATAIPTLPVLAAAAAAGKHDVVAAVDAIRGDWIVQRFRARAEEENREPLSEVELISTGELLEQGPCRVVGFGASRLSTEPGWRSAAIEVIEPTALAPVAARRWPARLIDWDPGRLTSPIYFRPPAVTPPKR